eukprot:NODE_2499_length_686_cov_56.084772_g2043_i0.p3 GENE.NODE_2499_length_686_cov_56.084772_g2043_i0~~NODE_2499_length_686_cov_56.084772_g2043_i0.p3  ORF type:complete len:201 (-),score=91.86 NODE_2499_length_686_cov_56.084772_g2043_i0:84-626(-)
MSDSEAEEDARIDQLFAFVADHTKDGEFTAVPEFVALLDKLGTEDAIVLGGMCFDPALVRAHFVTMAALDPGSALSEGVNQRHALLKACVPTGEESPGRALLAALEAYAARVCEDKQVQLEGFDATLKALWEWDVASEDTIRAWQADGKSAAQFGVKPEDAEVLREKGAAFLEWLEAGEE